MKVGILKRDMNSDLYLVPDDIAGDFSQIIDTMCEYIDAWDTDYLSMSSSFKKKFGQYKIADVEDLKVVLED